MRQIYKLLITGIIPFISAAPSFAQTDTVKASGANAFLFPTGIWIQAQSGSSGLDQKFLNKLAFGGYISQQKINKAEERIHNKNISGGLFSIYVIANIHATQDTAIRNKQSKFHPAYISLAQKNLFGASYDKAMWQLLFRGNDPYLGQKMEIKNTHFQQISYRNIGVGFANLLPLKNSKWSTQTEIGITQILSWRNLHVSNSSIFTDPDRNFVDVKYNLNYLNGVGKNGSGVGYGLYTSWKAFAKIKSGSIYFGINNLGVARISDIMQIQKSMDTAARIKQSNIGLKTLNSADWIDYFKDTLNQELAPDSSTISKWAMTPFELDLRYYSKQLAIDLQYIYMKGYLPRISIQPIKAFGQGSITFLPEIQFGGFDTYNLNFYLKHTSKKVDKVHLRTLAAIGVYGAEAWILPSKTHGAGISAMFYYFF